MITSQKYILNAITAKRVLNQIETLSTFSRNRWILGYVCSMKYMLAILLIGLTLIGCTDKKAVTQGRIHYIIDYPNQQDNFFLYSILPKEMVVDFKDGKLQSKISKANITNALIVDCNQKKVAAYFQYGEESFTVSLLQPDIASMLNGQKKYRIQRTTEHDTMAGFHVTKAIAVCTTNKKDRIDLWYTTEIAMENSNWYNPFKEIDGFLLGYSLERYGVRMDFRAVQFEDVAVSEAEMCLPKGGLKIPYLTYNSKLADLFKSFE